MNVTTNNNTTSSASYAEDGTIIAQEWQVGFILLAYVTAFVGSYSSIRLLEHGLWRSERERENATFVSKYSRLASALVMGTCTIWSMHFIGMQAVVLPGIQACYDWLPTLGSWFLSVAGVWGGFALASRDIFAGEDRVDKLKVLLRDDRHVTSKMNRQRASNHIHMVALFHKIHWIVAGSIIAALGALSMHFVGMIALQGPFQRRWSIPWVAAAAVLGVVVCFSGFWILFRPLHWKVEKNYYRMASAGVIALAICLLHFLGMLSVTYVADSSQTSICNKQWSEGSLQWRPDQIKVMCVAMAVQFIAFLIEHSISSELRVTYRQLLDIRLTHSQFMGGNSLVAPSMAGGSPFNLGSGGNSVCSSPTTSCAERPSGSCKRNVKVSGLTTPLGNNNNDETDSTSKAMSDGSRTEMSGPAAAMSWSGRLARRVTEAVIKWDQASRELQQEEGCSGTFHDSGLSDNQRNQQELWNAIYMVAQKAEENSDRLDDSLSDDMDFEESDSPFCTDEQTPAEQADDALPDGEATTRSTVPAMEPILEVPSAKDGASIVDLEEAEAGSCLGVDETVSSKADSEEDDDDDDDDDDEVASLTDQMEVLEGFRFRGSSLHLEEVLDDISLNHISLHRDSLALPKSARNMMISQPSDSSMDSSLSTFATSQQSLRTFFESWNPRSSTQTCPSFRVNNETQQSPKDLQRTETA